MDNKREVPKLVAICGSLRRDSHNKKLMLIIKQELESYNVMLQCLDLNEYELPLFNNDLVDGQLIPQVARELYNIVDAADGLLFISPEYCGSLPGVLKNAIDWISIPINLGDRTYKVFAKKPMAAAIATTSKFGGVKCGEHFRGIGGSLGAFMMPNILVIREAQDFDAIKMQHIGKFARELAEFMHGCYTQK